MNKKCIKLLLIIGIVFFTSMNVYARSCYKCDAMETTQAGKKYIYYWDDINNFDTIKNRQNCKKTENACCDGSKNCSTTESSSGTCYRCTLDNDMVHYYWKENLPRNSGNCTKVSDTTNCVNQKGDFYERPDIGTNRALNDSMAKVIKFIKRVVFNTIQIFVPILIIIMGSIDLCKAMLSGNDSEMKIAISAFVKKLIAGVAVFFVVTIVNVVMNAIAKSGADDTSSWKYYWNKS